MYTITGQVFDEQMETIPFATVFVSDSNGGHTLHAKNTSADVNGNWTLKGVDANDYLTVRMVGYAPKTFTVKSVLENPNRFIKVILQPDKSTQLEEFVVSAERDKPNYTKYYLLGGFLAIAIIGTSIYLAKK